MRSSSWVVTHSIRPLLRLTPLLALASSACATSTVRPASEQCPTDAQWLDPARPRHIFGNTWFVGTCGLSSLLVTSDAGHVLLDGATEEAAPLIEANIRALGFKVDDVRIIVTSHEHFDHVGGVAQLHHDTHATVMAREPMASALEQGHAGPGDPQFHSAKPFPPVATVQRLSESGTVTLGPLALEPHATFGHTQGSTSWSWTSCEGQICQHLVYADSLTAISDDDFRFCADPTVVAAFRRSLDTIEGLPCDVLLTPHPSASALWERLGSADSSLKPDPEACRRYAHGAREKLNARLARELDAGPAPMNCSLARQSHGG
jgi:metallo-beta-lactamase class B